MILLSKNVIYLLIYIKKWLNHIDSINNIVNSIHISSKNIIPNNLFYASTENYIKKLPLTKNKLIAFCDEWIALASAFPSIVKGLTQNNPFIKLDNNNNLKPVYIYLITDTTDFIPIASKNKVYKFQSAKPIIFTKKVLINEPLKKFKEMNVKII